MLQGSCESELVGSLASSSTYDEALLVCTDGYCIFNAEHRLSSYSNKLADLYPAIRDDLYLGMPYEDYLRLFIDKRAVQNLDGVDDQDAWVTAQANPSSKDASFKHHLHDGRWMLIKFHEVSGGDWLFVAFDISQLHRQQERLAESRRKFRDFAGLSSDWFWELDEHLCYKFYSSNVCERCDIEEGDFRGRSRIDVLLEDAVHDDQLHLHVSQLRRRESVDAVIEWEKEKYNGTFVHVRAEPQFGSTGQFCGYIGCGRDVSHEVKLQRKLTELAEIDDLTGIRNRRAFEQRLRQTISSLHYDWQPKSLVFADLDRFKSVNDGSGHQAGDELLKHVAKEFQSIMGEESMVARVGGDEFAAIVNLDIDQAYERVDEFISTIGQLVFEWKGRQYSIGASAGLTTINDCQSDASELMIQADTACYSAKNSGRNQARGFTHRGTRNLLKKKENNLLALVTNALDNNEILISLQPIVSTRQTDRQHRFEVLLSIKDPSRGIVTASEILPVAHKHNLSIRIDKYIVTRAIEHLNACLSLGVDIHLSVNLSGYSLADLHFREWLKLTLNDLVTNPSNLGFEFAESSLINNTDQLAQFAGTLREQGYQIALDDFGNQCSSIDFIRRIPLDFIKIDGHVISELTQNATSRVMLTTFIELSKNLGIKTIAEFVEDRETESLLLRAGVDYVQGFGIGKPQSAEYWLELFSNTERKLSSDNTLRRAS